MSLAIALIFIVAKVQKVPRIHNNTFHYILLSLFNGYDNSTLL